MTTIRAVIAQDNAPTLIDDYPAPQPGAEEVLVNVHATALNRADLLQVRGQYPPPPGAPATLGLELAGQVIAVGAGVTRWRVGDNVMALVAGGGYAEQAVVHQAHLLRIPHGMDYTEAAAIPEAFLTAYSNLIELGRLIAGERVLIHAGASGVGLAAIQIAKARGAVVFTTASAGKHAICSANGADMCIDYQAENFAERILTEYTDGMHLVIDFIGAPYWADNVRVLKMWGRLVFVGLMGGAQTEVNFGQIMAKRLTITGSTLRNRAHHRKTALIAAFAAWGLPLLQAGILKPNVWRIMALEEVASAHALMASNQNAGKIVLSIR